MEMKLVFVLGFLFLAGLAMANADEFSEYEDSVQNDEAAAQPKDSISADGQMIIAEDMNTETSTALVQNDANDPDSIKNKGFCHWGIAVWFKPGTHIRCNCMKCTCQTGGNWGCAFEFAYCPHFYCGNQIFNPNTQLCCCGKTYEKKAAHSCCGYYYYDTRNSKCCNYYAVKEKNSSCPRYRI